MADEEDPWGADSADEKKESTPVPAEAVKAATPGSPGTPKAAGTPKPSGTPRASVPTTPKLERSGSVLTAAESVGGRDLAEQAPQPPLALADDGYRKPVQLYRHWVRPQFLQYKYMYNYRTNYYDDVIDYLDKKQVGVTREIPRPQTWAERVLRTNYVSGRESDSYNSSNKKDSHLIQTLAAKIRTHNYHTKAYINQKYASVL